MRRIHALGATSIQNRAQGIDIEPMLFQKMILYQSQFITMQMNQFSA